MASGYTVFVTYLLSGATTSGYSTAVHCNYIKKLYLDTDVPDIEEIKIYFSKIDEFKFLNSSIGTGYSANKIYAVLQLVDNSGFTYASGVTPTAANWKLFNLTPTGVTSLTPTFLTSRVFNIPLNLYSGMTAYNLGYLNYPTNLQSNLLCFGDEVYFFGNVQTDIEAVVYTTDLSIPLPLKQFNSSNNNTWVNMSPKPKVYISEVGLYALDNGVLELVGIGKLNNPVPKDESISRTLVFNIDF
jgi:hypothetical protein